MKHISLITKVAYIFISVGALERKNLKAISMRFCMHIRVTSSRKLKLRAWDLCSTGGIGR